MEIKISISTGDEGKIPASWGKLKGGGGVLEVREVPMPAIECRTYV